MAKQNIEIAVKLDQKPLSINGKSLRLEDNLAGAESSRISNSPHETALELKYLKQKDFSPEDEGDKVYSFLEQCKLQNKIDVNFYLKEDFDTEVFPAVALTGKFNAAVYD